MGQVRTSSIDPLNPLNFYFQFTESNLRSWRKFVEDVRGHDDIHRTYNRQHVKNLVQSTEAQKLTRALLYRGVDAGYAAPQQTFRLTSLT